VKKSKLKHEELPLPDKWNGTPESKSRLHKDSQVVLRAFAAELGLKKGEFAVRSNPMGSAIGGMIYLETPSMRMWIEGGYGFESWGKSGEPTGQPETGLRRVDSYVMVRRCKDGKDVDFEHDFAVDWELLWDVKKLVEALQFEGFVE
jgi:hypothetical protein